MLPVQFLQINKSISSCCPGLQIGTASHKGSSVFHFSPSSLPLQHQCNSVALWKCKHGKVKEFSTSKQFTPRTCTENSAQPAAAGLVNLITLSRAEPHTSNTVNMTQSTQATTQASQRMGIPLQSASDELPLAGVVKPEGHVVQVVLLDAAGLYVPKGQALHLLVLLFTSSPAAQ